jgi:RHS repeat-associated protein
VYVRAADQLLSVIRPNGSGGWTPHYVHEDGLGSVRTITDSNGNTVDARSYEAFGTKNLEAGSDPLTYGFAGEAFDTTTHLAYHRARWMDSRVGRFAGMDPAVGSISDPKTLHRYFYAGNEPLGVTDPTGNDGVDAQQTNFGLGTNIHGPVGTEPPYSGDSYASVDDAIAAALSEAMQLSLTNTTTRVGKTEFDSQTPLATEYGGTIFAFNTSSGALKFAFDPPSTDGLARHYTLHPDRIPVNSTLAGIYHTHPNYGTYVDTTGARSPPFRPRFWSDGDENARNAIIQGYPLLSFQDAIEARYNNSLFGGGSDSFETDEWPSWASAPYQWGFE